MKTELYALDRAARHPRTPWYAKLVVAGFVDDLIFIPLFLPSAVLAECRMRARERVALYL